MEDIKKKAEEIERQLMSQFVAESMIPIDYQPEHSYSDSLEIADLQQQFRYFCLQAKANLVIDRANPNPSTVIVTLLKNSIQDYIANYDNRNNQFMKWLYDSFDDEIIIQQIKMLTKGLIYKDYEDVSKADKRKSLDPEQVSTTISLLVYFTILANDCYDADDFNRLFIETWFDYYENWMATELMFQMNGSSWRQQFKGVLLFD